MSIVPSAFAALATVAVTDVAGSFMAPGMARAISLTLTVVVGDVAVSVQVAINMCVVPLTADVSTWKNVVTPAPGAIALASVRSCVWSVVVLPVANSNAATVTVPLNGSPARSFLT